MLRRSKTVVSETPLCVSATLRSHWIALYETLGFLSGMAAQSKSRQASLPVVFGRYEIRVVPTLTISDGHIHVERGFSERIASKLNVGGVFYVFLQ
jgi:hypothetical protein